MLVTNQSARVLLCRGLSTIPVSSNTWGWAWTQPRGMLGQAGSWPFILHISGVFFSETASQVQHCWVFMVLFHCGKCSTWSIWETNFVPEFFTRGRETTQTVACVMSSAWAQLTTQDNEQIASPLWLPGISWAISCQHPKGFLNLEKPVMNRGRQSGANHRPSQSLASFFIQTNFKC